MTANKMMTAYKNLSESTPFTWVRFCSGQYQMGTNTGYGIMVDREDNRWFVSATEHQPEEIFTAEQDHPQKGFKTLTEAKEFAEVWAKEYDETMVDYCLECPTEYWKEWESDPMKIRDLKDAYVIPAIKARPSATWAF